ncbi:hypothetical protein C8Q73DRAFT_411724 [Cubamyces lactineus]|nr:hypothetical protein C8Q73DRAFT_411724 [Cubamyces lactineus]
MSSFYSLQDELNWLTLNGSNSPSEQPTTTFDNDLKPESFDQYINNASISFSEDFAPPADVNDPLTSNFDWSSAFFQLRPSPLSPSITTLDARSPSLSPSDSTLVDPPTPSTPATLNDTSAGVNVVDASQPTIFNNWEDFQFDFDPVRVIRIPYVQPTSPIEKDARASLSLPDTTTCHGQPQQQHLSPGAVAAFAFDGVRMQADSYPLTPQALEVPVPAAPSPASRPCKRSSKAGEVQADDVIVEEKKPAKRRRKQDTTKTIPCPICGSMWARQNNLDTHVKSVHRGERPHACPDGNCERTFSRKHDMRRHFQSEHTTLGSPRRKDVK